MKSIFIFRRDFRIFDNTGLIKCIKDSQEIYPIFIFTPEQIKNNDYKSDTAVQFMIDSLFYLKKKINLTFLYGDYIKVLKNITKKYNIDAIYTNTDYTNYAIKRDKNIEIFCKKKNILFKYFHDICLFEPNSIKTQQYKVYQKFTPFYKVCLKQKVLEPIRINIDKYKIKSVKSKYKVDKNEINTYFTYNKDINIIGGRKNGKNILKKLNSFKNYKNTRNDMNLKTTELSGYIKFGCVSIREVYFKIKDIFNINHDLIKQLIWRDFYYHLGFGFNDRFGKSLKQNYDKIKWDNNIKKLNTWKNGETGYPIVDAGMKQINTTGYMHNRARMIVASFLIKNLQIDWQLGEKYFAQKLLDYDVLVNNGNWQWVSGSGADSMPYFRIFNPWTQSKKFDKDCKYIKKWLPNLSNVENKHLHEWDKYFSEYNLDDIKYHKPIINYKDSREKTIKMYKEGII